MNPNRRALVIGGIIAALLVAGLVVGLVVLRGPDRIVGPTDGASPVPAEVRAEVETAYLRYWEVLAEATESLDASRLPEVMSGEALELARGLIEEQRAKNEPLRTQVEHNYRIVIIDEATASVDDTFRDRTVRLDPDTREPTGPPADRMIRNSYTMKKENGVWKVAFIIQQR